MEINYECVFCNKVNILTKQKEVFEEINSQLTKLKETNAFQTNENSNLVIKINKIQKELKQARDTNSDIVIEYNEKISKKDEILKEFDEKNKEIEKILLTVQSKDEEKNKSITLSETSLIELNKKYSYMTSQYETIAQRCILLEKDKVILKSEFEEYKSKQKPLPNPPESTKPSPPNTEELEKYRAEIKANIQKEFESKLGIEKTKFDSMVQEIQDRYKSGTIKIPLKKKS